MQFRGGSSKGIYFNASDLPRDPDQRDRILLDALGRDVRQIDGMGGGDPLTSKIAIVSQSTLENADIDYLFAQVVVGENRVDITPNCGNILAGVGPYAIESGMVSPQLDTTTIRINMLNSGKLCELVVQTPGGKVCYQGNTRIDGVPGSSAPILCTYLDTAGSACGALLPTGNPVDIVDGIPVTCIDNGMPVVLIQAEAFSKTGYETPDELMADNRLRRRLETLRLQIGPMMNLGNVRNKVTPKISLLAAPRDGGHISTRTFIPHTCHAAIGVLGAVSVATACTLPDSVAADIATVPEGNPIMIAIEHPCGAFSVQLERDQTGKVIKAGLIRTARLLSKGELYVQED